MKTKCMKITHLLAILSKLSSCCLMQSLCSHSCAASCALPALKNCLPFFWSSLLCECWKVSTTTAQWSLQDREYLEAVNQSVLGFSYICPWVHYIKKEVLNMYPASIMQHPNTDKLPLRSLGFESLEAYYLGVIPLLVPWEANAEIQTDGNWNKSYFSNSLHGFMYDLTSHTV